MARRRTTPLAGAHVVEALGVAIVFAGVALPLAIIGFREATGRRHAEVRAAIADVNQTSLASMLADSTTREKEATQRADRLAAAHQKILLQLAARGPAGSYAFLLQIMSEADAAEGGDGNAIVPTPRSADVAAGTELLDPSKDG